MSHKGQINYKKISIQKIRILTYLKQSKDFYTQGISIIYENT